MRLQPNLQTPWRIAYLLIGIGLLLSPLAIQPGGWMRIALPILGFMSAVTSATGW